MKKKDQQLKIVYDWGELVAALRDVIDGALNAAAKMATHEEEWDAIGNVRDFVYDWLAGRRAEVSLTDLLLAIGSILAAIEIDLGIDSAELLEPLRTLIEMPSRLPRVIRLPGADTRDRPTTVIRRFRRRNAAPTVTAIAA